MRYWEDFEPPIDEGMDWSESDEQIYDEYCEMEGWVETNGKSTREDS